VSWFSEIWGHLVSWPGWGQIGDWLDHHNGLITALATVALAALTAMLALENRRLLQASTRATDATERALDLDWRPVLTFDHVTSSSRLGSTGISIAYAATHVRNVGRGPALNVRFLHRRAKDDGSRAWQMTKRFSLAGGGDTVAGHSWVETDENSVAEKGEPADDVWGGPFPLVNEVLICQDQAGRLYRFVDPEPVPAEWRVGDGKKAWVEWHRGLVSSE
jgi:hypothetical protein